MLLNVCTNNEVCRFSRIWNIDNCMEKTEMTSPWRHPKFDFYDILIQICKGHIKAAYQISDWSNKRELRYTVKLTENYKEKMNFVPLWPWPKVTNFNRVQASVLSNRLAKTASKSVHPLGWNFVHKKRAGQTDTHTQTHRHTDKLEWKYNPSTISWRCNDKFIYASIQWKLQFIHSFIHSHYHSHFYAYKLGLIRNTGTITDLDVDLTRYLKFRNCLMINTSLLDWECLLNL